MAHPLQERLDQLWKDADAIRREIRRVWKNEDDARQMDAALRAALDRIDQVREWVARGDFPEVPPPPQGDQP